MYLDLKMRTYAYIRTDPNNKVESINYFSFFSDYGYKIQKNRLVIEEVVVSKSISYRDRLLNLINYSLEIDDSLVIKGLDCLGSNYEEIFNTIKKIDEKKIKLVCLDYSKNEIEGDLKIFFLHFISMCVEFEKKFNLSTTKDLTTSKKIGRPESLSEVQKVKVVEKYKCGRSVYALAKEFSVTRTVIQRILNKAKNSEMY